MQISKWNKKYAFAIVCFVIGTTLLLLPSPAKKVIEELPLTGEGAQLSIEVTASRSEVQRDDPSAGAQAINYTIEISNDAECTQTPVDIVLTFDKSGSMGNLMSDARQAGIAFVRNLDFSKDQAAVVTYDENAYLNSELTDSQTQLRNTINSISAGGMTNIGDAIDIAKTELLSARHNPLATSVMIIFTDGRPNRPSGVDAKDYAIDKSSEAKRAGIRVISIAYGSHADTDLMQQIASSGPGNYYYAPTGDDLITIYAAISQSLQNTSSDTRVTVDLNLITNFIDVVDISDSGTFLNGALSWNIGSLACLETRTLTFSLTVNSNASDLDVVDIVAQATNSNGDNVQSLEEITTIHAPAFNLSKTDAKDEAMPGEKLEYEITAQNVGTGNAYEVKFVDTLPFQYFILWPRSISNSGVFDASTDTITWDNNDEGYILDGSHMPTGSEFASSISFEFSGDVESNLSNGIYILEDTIELETASGFTQQAVDQTRIPYGCDLEITKSSDPLRYTSWGGEVTYTLTVINNGRIDAQQVAVQDDYNEVYMSIADEGGGTDSSGVISWDIDTLAVGESHAFTYTVDIVDLATENTVTIPNQANVTSDTFDLDESNNIVLHEIVATSDPILEITKTSDKEIYNIDEEITYTITITNNSNADAYNLNLVDLILAEFDYVSGTTTIDGVSASDPEGTRILSWSLGDLSAGENLIVKFTVRANETCREVSYTSGATITWQDEDGNSFGPQTAECTISIIDTTQEAIGDVITELQEESVEPSSLLAAVSSLVRTGEALVYLKVIVGLALALPLPLLLIFDKKRKRAKKRKPKETVLHIKKDVKKKVKSENARKRKKRRRKKKS